MSEAPRGQWQKNKLMNVWYHFYHIVYEYYGDEAKHISYMQCVLFAINKRKNRDLGLLAASLVVIDCKLQLHVAY